MGISTGPPPTSPSRPFPVPISDGDVAQKNPPTNDEIEYENENLIIVKKLDTEYFENQEDSLYDIDNVEQGEIDIESPQVEKHHHHHHHHHKHKHHHKHHHDHGEEQQQVGIENKKNDSVAQSNEETNDNETALVLYE